MSNAKIDKAAKIATDFRALHEEPEAFLLPNPWDPGSAKMLENVGFKALATSSGAMAWTLGKLDGAVTREDAMHHCETLCDAVDIPISADLGPGFGATPNEIAETIRLAAQTGLAGCSIEDAVNPYLGGEYEFENAVDRVRAAAEAARGLSRDFVLTARCEQFSTGKRDLAETIKRLNAYAEAGADVLYAPGVMTRDEITAICNDTDKPINVLRGFRQFDIPSDELQSLGVKRISLGTDLARIAYGAMLNAAHEFVKTGAINEHDINARSKDIAAAFM